MKTLNRIRGLNIALASALALAGAGLSNDSVAAGTATANLSVTATVLGTCTIATSPVAFGPYEATAPTALSGTGSVTLTCADGAAALVTLGEGLFPFSAAPATPLRQMAFGVNRLAYFLFQDAAHSIVWGNTVATGVAQAGTGVAGAPLIVYGAVTAGQNVPIGSYADTVIATVTF